MVDESPWPIFGSLGLSNVLLSTYLMISGSGNIFYFISSVLSLLILTLMWWRDVIRESTIEGNHTFKVVQGIELGMVLFITSEFMLFFSIFFSFFYCGLNPDWELGGVWPPNGVTPLDYISTPLLNSLILFSSGISVTWSFHALLKNDSPSCLWGLLFTILLGWIFSILQYIEYFECSFSMADSVFGSLFFFATGLHGMHVIIGTLFLMTMMWRIYKNQVNYLHHVGFELAVWYWHFVDFVWLILFVSMYFWCG